MYGGEGWRALDGRVVFAPFVLPGERMLRRARAGEARAGAGAGCSKCWTTAPERVAAPCPYFGRCGGCHYQHAPYELQLGPSARFWWKSCGGWARSSRRRRSRWSPASRGAIATARSFTLPDADRVSGSAVAHAVCGHAVSDSSPRVNEAIGGAAADAARRALAALRAVARSFHRRAQVQLNVWRRTGRWRGAFSSGARKQFPDLSAARWIIRRRDSYASSGKSFFQVNRFLIDGLVRDGDRTTRRGESALDLYAGVGLFSLPLARRFAAGDGGGIRARRRCGICTSMPSGPG